MCTKHYERRTTIQIWTVFYFVFASLPKSCRISHQMGLYIELAQIYSEDKQHLVSLDGNSATLRPPAIYLAIILHSGVGWTLGLWKQRMKDVQSTSRNVTESLMQHPIYISRVILARSSINKKRLYSSVFVHSNGFSSCC